MKLFNVIVVGIFIALAFTAVFIFATYRSATSQAVGTVVIWGTVPEGPVSGLLSQLAGNTDTYTHVSYKSVPAGEFISDLVEAIAAGNGPDLVIFPADDIVSQSDKLETIPFSIMSKRDFENAYLQAGEPFVTANGILGFPFSVDPLVMYWNRSLFAAAGLASPPQYWDELSVDAPKLTRADQNGTLTQSAVALGSWTNVDHAKEIYLTLLNQLGNNVVMPDGKGGYQLVYLNDATGGVSSADSATRFYTDFADPVKPVYSWNRSEPESQQAFVSGTLAIYFGTVSELSGIRAANPNLNFDVAPVPSIRGAGSGVAASVAGFSIPRGSKNPNGALLVAEALTSKKLEDLMPAAFSLPSVRRDAAAPAPSDQYGGMFRQAALVSFSFLDPDPTSTDSIFSELMANVSSGKLQVSDATRAASAEMETLFKVQ